MFTKKEIRRWTRRRHCQRSLLCVPKPNIVQVTWTTRCARWGLDEEARQRVIDYLVSHQYVDNERYCRAFVNDKVKYNHWGRNKIAQALWQKRVPEDIATAVLDEVPEEDYLDVLRPMLKAKWPTIKADTDYERSMKLIRFAMGRGFELDTIKKALPES